MGLVFGNKWESESNIYRNRENGIFCGNVEEGIGTHILFAHISSYWCYHCIVFVTATYFYVLQLPFYGEQRWQGLREVAHFSIIFFSFSCH